MQTVIRNSKKINIFQYTQEFKDELISNGPGELEDDIFIVIPGMADTEFYWNYTKKELTIVYSNYNNFYENVTPENFRNPEIINIGDYIVKEEGVYHLESEKEFNLKMK